ncbi:MAG: hypothetical protein HC866_20835 [Leptolyngbyaceae cyanobacterium RU_5_1]|nr:hypothetical protein [Leptolyngbyaceae cyanobacterium RU_5_1]
MNMKPSRPRLLFWLSCQLLKYFLLVLFGFTLFCLLSWTFGALHIATLLMSALGKWILRLGILVLGFMATAIVCESVRQ